MRQRKGAKEVEVAGGREVEFAERAAVDGDNVGKPEREIRQVFRNDLLDFTAERLPEDGSGDAVREQATI